MKIMTRLFFISLISIGSFQVAADGDATHSILKVCKECHGVEGKTQVPGWPDLSSMRYEEIKRKLEAYRDGLVPDSRMKDVSHTLDDRDIQVVAEFYSSIISNVKSDETQLRE